ncbi:MAG: glycosyltransferase [Prevotella sp.]|nr:glycosyltransferase [Prevotella sp.]
MIEKKLSIVIPMYDSENYMERIVASIYGSNLPIELFDVVVVNDGSKDKGPEIVERLMKDHDNLRMVNRENGGLSMARNTGIDNAETKYIWFVDSDDLVSSDLTPIINVLENDKNIDVFDFVFEWCFKMGDKTTKRKGFGATHSKVPHDVIISGREAIIKGFMPSSVCALLLRRDFLLKNNLRFKKGLTQQDVEFTYRMMAVAEKVIFKNDIIYNYIIRNGSISHTKTGAKWIKYQSDKVEIVDSFYKLAQSFKDKDKELSRKIQDHADGALFGCVYNLYKNREEWRGNGVNEAVLAKLKEHKFYPLHLPIRNFKRWAMSFILNREFLLK